ncbi:MAG: DNA polymerase/3'-5' exonuclease PolX [Bacteroidetes bacterium]|nr:MAG: DNA polymerase/3'-5' exonuclease PolX [Bacteroidota bacterium]
MFTNREIRKKISLYAELLQLHEKDEALSKKLSSAAYFLRRIEGEIASFTTKKISALFRPPIGKIILELLESGSISALDELIELTPGGLFELMQIKGLGGKKLALLWKKGKIDTLEGLLKACEQKAIRKLPGFGSTSEENIRKGIQSHLDQQNHFHLATVATHAEDILKLIRKISPGSLTEFCGGIRRLNPTVAGIEIITTLDNNAIAKNSKKYMVIKSSSADKTYGISHEEIPVTIYHTNTSNFHLDRFRLTGNEQHVLKVMAKIPRTAKSFSSEKSIYQKAGLPYIVPEMRENLAEWDYKANPEDLIRFEDIRGVVHNHTTYSDGVDKLGDFVKACKQKNFEYVVISDHSKNAHYAGGLKEEKVLKQFLEIDKLQKEMKSIRIFKSIECDIKVNGDLDYENSFLKKFDLVIVSIHQQLKMDEAKATRRLLKAIEQPYTTILGHMTGRLLLMRPGYPVNYKKIIDACAANRVIIEINSNPYRLDMDWTQIPYALNKGVWISINPDAHSIREIDNIKWGIAAARKAGLIRAKTWNALPLNRIEEYLKWKKSNSKEIFK